MTNSRTSSLTRLLILLVALLILKVNAQVVWNYRNYLPPDFNSDFLRGRESYFFGAYQWAFYLHIAAGPVSLVAGLLLVSERFRRWRPKWHRRLGRFQVANVLLLVAPSGLWMAYYAAPGPVAEVGFAMLAVSTGLCAALGWRAAVRRRFAVHREWMWRCFLLLCSAVVLRIVGGAGAVFEVQAAWYDPLASWACWVVPVGVFEVCAKWKRRAGSGKA